MEIARLLLNELRDPGQQDRMNWTGNGLALHPPTHGRAWLGSVYSLRDRVLFN